MTSAVLFVYKTSRFLQEKYVPVKLPDDENVRNSILETINYFDMNMFDTLVVSRNKETKEIRLFKTSTPFHNSVVKDGLDLIGVDQYMWWDSVIDTCKNYCNISFCKYITNLNILDSCKMVIEG